MSEAALIRLIDPELGARSFVCRERGDLAGAGRDLAVLLNAADGDIALVGELLAVSRSNDAFGDRYRPTLEAEAGDTNRFCYEVRAGLGSTVEVGVWNRPDGENWQAIMKPADGTKHGPSGPSAGAAQSTKKRKKDADHVTFATFVDLVNRANKKLEAVPAQRAIGDAEVESWLADWRLRTANGAQMVAIKRASVADDRAFARGEEPVGDDDEAGMRPTSG